MTVPQTNLNPPFNITRASHIALTVNDLPACRAFYEDVIGLVVSDADGDSLYMRGVEEICHHSLVLRQTGGPPVCEAVGLRVFTEEDMDKAFAHFRREYIPGEWVERPH